MIAYESVTSSTAFLDPEQYGASGVIVIRTPWTGETRNYRALVEEDYEKVVRDARKAIEEMRLALMHSGSPPIPPDESRPPSLPARIRPPARFSTTPKPTACLRPFRAGKARRPRRARPGGAARRKRALASDR